MPQPALWTPWASLLVVAALVGFQVSCSEGRAQDLRTGYLRCTIHLTLEVSPKLLVEPVGGSEMHKCGCARAYMVWSLCYAVVQTRLPHICHTQYSKDEANIEDFQDLQFGQRSSGMVHSWVICIELNPGLLGI